MPLITLDDTTSRWLREVIKSHKRSKQISIPQTELEVLLHLGYVLGTKEDFSPTAKAYAWVGENEAAKKPAKSPALEGTRLF